jgi:hypothetical protein
VPCELHRSRLLRFYLKDDEGLATAGQQGLWRVFVLSYEQDKKKSFCLTQ